MTEFRELTAEYLAEEITVLSNTKKVFLVHGKNSFTQCGAEPVFTKTAQLANCILFHFSSFSDNPKWTEIQNGLLFFKESKADCILGIGGGSALDTAKLIRFFSAYNGNPEQNTYMKIAPLIPLLLFPTTAGTGSEATHFAVCYINGSKYSIAHQDIIPTKSYIDARFTYSASPYITACTGFDAFSQAIESYWSVRSTAESRQYAAQAIKLMVLD